MTESNTPDRAKQRSRGTAKRTRSSEKKGPCREEQPGMTCSGGQPQDQGKQTPASKQRHDPEEQRPGSTEKSPG